MTKPNVIGLDIYISLDCPQLESLKSELADLIENKGGVILLEGYELDNWNIFCAVPVALAAEISEFEQVTVKQFRYLHAHQN